MSTIFHQIAYSYIDSKAQWFKIKKNVYEDAFVHLHVPTGAILKKALAQELPWPVYLYRYSVDED
jgi:hypothetical protein